MQHLIQYYFRAVLLKANPQDCPSSYVLQLTLIFLYLALSIFNTLALYDLWRSVTHSMLDLAVLYLFVQILLTKNRERIHQTFNAFMGAGICIGLVHTIFSYIFIVDRNQESISELGTILFFLVFIWVVVVYGHIVRHAVGVSLLSGISISLGYTLINAFLLLTIIDVLDI